MQYFRQLDPVWQHVLIGVVIIVGAAITTRIARWLINRAMRTAEERFGADRTKYAFFKNAVSLIIWLIAIGLIISTVPELKALAVTLFAGAGILVAAVGFAAQQSFANIVSGIFIVFFKPFRVGDMIRVQTFHGIVEDITLQHTVILNFENKRVIIPNSIIGNESIINDSIQEEKVCRWIEVGISYDSDVDLATKIIQEVAMAHPNCIDNRTSEEKAKGQHPVNVRLMNFGNSSLDLRAYVWTDDPFNAIQMHSDINREIKMQFDAQGVEIPFPYHTLVYKNDLPPNAKLNPDG
jgi:small-conductance mechanosensitive channel